MACSTDAIFSRLKAMANPSPLGEGAPSVRAGYLEDWTYNATLSGSPQGAVVSPVLSKIYLSKLDAFVEQTLMPTYTRGTRRRINPPWERLRSASTTLRLVGRFQEARRLRRHMQTVPSLDPQDPTYRRLRYVRYADDCVPRTHERRFDVEPT
jgi:hypothetical protein